MEDPAASECHATSHTCSCIAADCPCTDLDNVLTTTDVHRNQSRRWQSAGLSAKTDPHFRSKDDQPIGAGFAQNRRPISCPCSQRPFSMSSRNRWREIASIGGLAKYGDAVSLSKTSSGFTTQLFALPASRPSHERRSARWVRIHSVRSRCLCTVDFRPRVDMKMFYNSHGVLAGARSLTSATVIRRCFDSTTKTSMSPNVWPLARAILCPPTRTTCFFTIVRKSGK